MTYTIGSLFSGIGGFDLAGAWAGFETAWFVEREPFCQQVLGKHWPGVPVYGDIYEAHDLPYVDVITAGFPCQPFSLAGKRLGSEDERFLIPEMLRVIDEVQPMVVLLENVPGFPSLNDGAEFRALLGALAGMGYNAQWGHLRASDVEAPHRRERWFCVVYRNCRNSHRGAEPDNRGADGIAMGSEESKPLADTTTQGLQESGQAWKPSGNQEGAKGMVSGFERCSKLGDATGIRRQHHQPKPGIVGTGENNGRMLKPAGTSAGHTKPGMGRTPDGLPGRLDFPGFPSLPGEEQYAYEPPRVVSKPGANRAARIKALGNAVVPQVVYPIMLSIHEWLEGE